MTLLSVKSCIKLLRKGLQNICYCVLSYNSSFYICNRINIPSWFKITSFVCQFKCNSYRSIHYNSLEVIKLYMYCSISHKTLPFSIVSMLFTVKKIIYFFDYFKDFQTIHLSDAPFRYLFVCLQHIISPCFPVNQKQILSYCCNISGIIYQNLDKLYKIHLSFNKCVCNSLIWQLYFPYLYSIFSVVFQSLSFSYPRLRLFHKHIKYTNMKSSITQFTDKIEKCRPCTCAQCKKHTPVLLYHCPQPDKTKSSNHGKTHHDDL